MPGGPYMGGGWHHRPRRYGGGCLGGMLSMILAPILIIVLVVSVLLSAVSSTVRTTANGGTVLYDEEKLQDYANEQYAGAFDSSTAYEDNLLIVFLVDEEHSDYYYIAWVGDHIATDINYMLGNNQTELGQAMSQSINTSSYKYSLDSNLAQVMETMTAEVESLGLESSFKCSENHIQAQSRLKNYSSLELTESTVNDALADFTDATGIPTVIVVEDMEDVFGKTTSGRTVKTVIVVVVLIFAIVLISKGFRRRKNDGYDNRYRDFDY